MKKNIGLMALTGILTLASCSNNNGADTTLPTVTLAASPASLSNAGGTVTLNGTASDASGVSSVVVTRNDGTVIPCSTVDANGAFSCTTSLPANATSSAIDYTYTAKATDKASTPNSATSAAAKVTVAGKGDTTQPGNGNDTKPTATITITSPKNGDTAAINTPVTVRFDTSAGLDSATCTVNGVDSKATVSTSGGYCAVTPTAAGSNTITVTGVKAGYTVNSASVAVQTPAATVSVVVPQADQELKIGADGTVQDADNGWRYLGQGVSTPSDPTSHTDLYVKGVVNFTVTGVAGQKTEVLLAKTTGSDVPSNDDIQAADVLVAQVSATGTETIAFDSTRLAEMEGVRQWIVVRVNGTKLYFQPVISDNRGPQQPAVEFMSTGGATDAIKRDYNGAINNNWARGNVTLVTTNPSLQDREFGQAPVGASFVNRHPAGFESIRYYVVPGDYFTNKSVNESDEKLLAKAIKTGAIWKSGAILAPGTNLARAFSTVFDSKANIPQAQEGVLYRIYAVSRDQLGNETASATYQNLRFDNTGPSITKSVIKDVSNLPFPSSDPYHCISDYASVDLSGFADAAGGIGLNGDAAFNIGGINLNDTALYTTYNGAKVLDTNKLADGKYAIDYSKVTDVLGNPAVGTPANDVVTIDNTDPTGNFNRPVMQAQVTSGDRVTTEMNAQDGGCGVNTMRLFWDSYYTGLNTVNVTTDDTTYASVGHPVQFARVDSQNSAAGTLNAGWNSLAIPAGNGGNVPYQVSLRGLIIDGAGNASFINTPIIVKPKVTNVARPTLGLMDAYTRNESMSLGTNSNAIAAVNFSGSDITPNLTSPENTLLDSLLTLDGMNTVTNNAGEKLRDVSNYGRFDLGMWGKITDWQITSDPTLNSTQDEIDYSSIQDLRTKQWNTRTPWLYVSSSDTANNKGQFTANSALLNDLYWSRVLNNPSDVTANDMTYDEFNGIASDTAGSYSFFGEKVNK